MDTFKTYSPIDNSLYVERPYASKEEIESSLERAKVAQASWAFTSILDRKKYCLAAVEYIRSHSREIAEEITWQMGRPIGYAEGEIKGFSERALYMIDIAEQALSPIKLPEKEGFVRYIKRVPLGLSVIIAPWNYPFLTAVNALIPALMAGNTVLLKHSSQTPLVAERLANAFQYASLPLGVFQYLHLRHSDTLELIRLPIVDSVSFTGSVQGGKEIEAAVSGRFISLGLELGGKDPAYVREDADLDLAVETLIDGAFFNSGQSCCGIERIYVHKKVYKEFLRKAVYAVQNYKLGRPDDINTTLGPMVRASAADFVRAQIEEAIEQGAVAHIDPTDFPVSKPGTPYLAPQILTNVTHHMRIMNEETFGPVVGIMEVDSDEEAIRLMNDSQYGLTACICTKDIAKGIALGDQLETGTFFINRCDYLDPALAWTGVKQSGRGCSLSSLGYEYVTRPKSYHIKL